MATRPATAPEAAPNVVAWPPLSRSTTSQPSMAAAAALLVLRKAWAARPLAARAEPQHARPEQRERQRVGRHLLAGPSLAAAEHEDDGQRGDPGVDVDDRAAGEVERPELEQPADRGEHPVGDGSVDEHEPGAEEDDPGPRLQPDGDGDGVVGGGE